MLIGIQHSITDAANWQQSAQSVMNKMESGTLPAGLKPVLFLPAVNGKSAFCVWESNSLDSVKNFIDGETGKGARNEYFQVDAEHAIGLPQATAATV